MMSHPTVDNLAGSLQSLLALMIMLLGLGVMLRGVGVIGWVLSGIARLLAPLAGVLFRGLVIFAILGALYLLVAPKLAERHQGQGAGPAPAESNRVRRSHDYEH